MFKKYCNSYCDLFTHFDIYHLPNYLNLKASISNSTPIYWKSENTKYSCIIPFIEQLITNIDKYELYSPYGYSGVLSNSKLTKKEIQDVLYEFNIDAKQQGYISSFIRLNPLTNKWQDLSNKNIKQVKHGNTVYISLNSKIEDIRSLYSKNHKRNLKRLKDKRFKTSINDWSKLNLFHEIYIQTMLRNNAAKRYFLPLDYFISLKEIKEANIFFISVDSANKEFTCGGLFSLVNGVIQFLYGATANEFVKMSPSKLMIDKAIEYGIQKNAKILHLGGGYGANVHDGLFRFKSGFSKQFLNYSTLRIIHNQEEYNKLCKDKGISDEDIDSMEGFFPAYRRDE